MAAFSFILKRIPILEDSANATEILIFTTFCLLNYIYENIELICK